MTKKDTILWAFGLAAFFIVISCICFDCSRPEIPVNSKPNHDSIYEAEQKDDAIIKSYIGKDSILAITKIKYVHHYHTVYDSLYITDTLCQQSLVTLYNAFGDLNNTNDTMLSNKDTIIKTLIHKLSTKQNHIAIDSSYIILLCDSMPKVRRKAFRKGLFKGILTGAVIVEGMNVAAKIKP